LTLVHSETIPHILVQNEKDSGDNSAQLCIPPISNLVHDFVIFATQLGHHNATVTAVIEEFYRAECDNVRVLLLFTLRRARYRKKEET